MARGSKSEVIEMGPTEDVILSLIDALVDPLLPLSVSDVLPQEDAQKSVAKQMFAVASMYNYYYYYRDDKPDLRYLDFASFSKLSVVLKPTLASYMKSMMGSQPCISDDSLSITEKAIKEACDTVLSLDSQSFTDWPISKVAVLLIDSKNKNCMLRFGDVTEGVWSLFEKCLVEKSDKINPKKKKSEEKVGGKRKRNSLSICDSVLLQLAYDAVEDDTGIKSSELKLLATHVTYSLTEEKSAVQFYMMQCSRSFSIREQVPLNFLVESLQGPLVEELERGMWRNTSAVEFYHMLPYVEFISFWLSGKDFRVPTLKRRDSQSNADSCEEEVDQTVIQNSNNDDSGKNPTEDSENVRNLVILENEEVKVNSEIPETEKEVDRTVESDLPVPNNDVDDDDFGNTDFWMEDFPEMLPTENSEISEHVSGPVILKNEEIAVDFEILDAEKEVVQTVTSDLPVLKHSDDDESGNTNNGMEVDMPEKMPTESEQVFSLVSLENEEIGVDFGILDADKEVVQTVTSDLPVLKHGVNDVESGNTNNGMEVGLPEKMGTENSEQVFSLVSLENEEIEVDFEILDADKEVVQTVTSDLPVLKHGVNDDVSGNTNNGMELDMPEKMPTESEQVFSLISLENEEIEVDFEILDADKEVVQTVTSDLPVLKHSVNDDEPSKTNNGMEFHLPENAENSEHVFSLENEEIEVSSEILDADKEVVQTVTSDLPVLKHSVNDDESVNTNNGIDVELPEKMHTENREQVLSLAILENEKIKNGSEIPDTEKEIIQSERLDLPVPKNIVNDDESGNTNFGMEVDFSEKVPTENDEQSDLFVLENMRIEVASKISDTEEEVIQAVKSDLPAPDHEYSVNDSESSCPISEMKVDVPEKMPTENSYQVSNLAILENRRIEVDSKISDAEKEAIQTVKLDLPAPDSEHSVKDSESINIISGMKFDLLEIMPSENSNLVIIENERIRVDSEISDAEKEVIEAVKSGSTENSEQVFSLFIQRNEEIKADSKILDTEKEVIQTVKSDLPSPNPKHGVDDNDSSNTNTGKKMDCEILDKVVDECDEIQLLLPGHSNELTTKTENASTCNNVSLKLRVYQSSRKRKRNLPASNEARVVAEDDGNLKANMVDEKMLSEVEREMEKQVILFEDKTKCNLELQNVSTSEDPHNALSDLFVKRRKLHSQMCSKIDSLAFCESYIARIRDGGEIDLAAKCVETITTGNYHSMLELGLESEDYGKPQGHQNKSDLSGFYIPGKSSCEDLEFTCLKNNWGLPRYIVEPSNGKFVADVFVHVKDGELHSMGGLESKPCEARESAAAQMMIAKLGSINE